MPKYLLSGCYVGEGIAGLLEDGGTKRRTAVEKLIASAGGKLESMYFALGESDFYVIADMPDQSSAVAAALVTNASGAVSLKTTVLLTAEEIDNATKKRPDYTPPGR